MSDKRLIVIGLDGATWDYIKPALADGRLPNLAKLISTSACADLRSTIPPITPTAWSTFSTGVNPGKHGVYNFSAGLDAFNDSNVPQLVTSRSIRSPVIWDILSDKKKRVCVLNVPLTYPPAPVNGIMITGMMTPSDKVTYTYPPDLFNDESLVAGLGSYRLDHNPVKTELADRDLDEWLDDYFKIEEQRIKYAARLLGRENWDFFMVVFGITDRIGHLFWQYMDTEVEENLQIPESFRQAVHRAYKTADKAVGALLEQAGDNDYIMLMSDHGFGRVDRLFIANCWLEREGFLTLRKPTLSSFREIYHIAKVEKPLLMWLARMGLMKAARLLPKDALAKLIPIWIPRRVKSRFAVDWEKTSAYAHGYGITANLKGREPFGIVKPGEEHSNLLTEISDRLMQAQDQEQGGRLVEEIYLTSEIYAGDQNTDAPDILFRMKGDTICPVSGFDFKKILTRNPHGSGHFLHGIFSLRGHGIQQDQEPREFRIEDLAPTIFHLLDLPVPRHMDGRIIEELFDTEIFSEAPRYESLDQVRFDRSREDGSEMSESERKSVADRLKGLGYLS